MKASRINVLISILLIAAFCAAATAKPSAQSVRRKRAAAGKSPMPRVRHEVRWEELALVRPKPNADDEAVAELCRRYARSNAPARARMRRALSEYDLGVLDGFAGRAAVFGLRERSAEKIADGLTALAMIEGRRTDYRDIIVTLGLLNHSAVRIGADAGKLFRDAAALAEPVTSRIIVEFNRRSPAAKDMHDVSGYAEVETEAGVGFISFGIDEYDPTYDLKKVAIAVADLLLADKYDPTTVEVGSNLPPVWLESDDDNTRLERAMGSVRAGAKVGGDLRQFDTSHMFIVFILELSDESSARTLLSLSEELGPSREKDIEKGPPGYSMLGVAEGRLFCLVVASPSAEGAKPVESRRSLVRFEEGLAEILRRAAKARRGVETAAGI